MKQPSEQKRPPNIRFLFIVGLSLIVVGTNTGVFGLTIAGIVFVGFGVLYYNK